jgi:hypothetical protein
MKNIRKSIGTIKNQSISLNLDNFLKKKEKRKKKIKKIKNKNKKENLRVFFMSSFYHEKKINNI